MRGLRHLKPRHLCRGVRQLNRGDESTATFDEDDQKRLRRSPVFFVVANWNVSIAPLGSILQFEDIPIDGVLTHEAL